MVWLQSTFLVYKSAKISNIPLDHQRVPFWRFLELTINTAIALLVLLGLRYGTAYLVIFETKQLLDLSKSRSRHVYSHKHTMHNV